MTDKQRMYLELCKAGYSLEEISSMTGKTASTILRTLINAVQPSCRGSDRCRTCLLKSACEINFSSVMKLKAPGGRRRPIASSGERVQKGRYSY